MLGKNGKTVTSAKESTYPSTVLKQETVAVKPEGLPVYVAQGNGDWYWDTLKNSKVEKQMEDPTEWPLKSWACQTT